VSQSTSEPDPGWYPDFADPTLERWWDGSAWSPVTRPAEADVPASVASAASGSGRSALREGGQPAPADGGEPARAGDVVPARSSDAQPVPTDRGQPVPARDQPAAIPDPGSSTDLAGGPDAVAHGGPGTANPYAPPPDWFAPGAPLGGSPVGPVPEQPPPYRPHLLRHPIAGPATPDGVPLALPGRRLVARLFDTLITSVLTAATGAYYLAQMWHLAGPQLRATAAGRPGADPYTLLEDPAFTDAMLRYAFVGLLVGGVYFVVLTHLFGGTMGKLMAGIRVRSWHEAGRPTWGQALARWLTREVVAQITFAGIGSIYWIMDSVWLLWDPRRQCLHDKIPGTVVVQHR
jgi:uncharacterized RDD family membrane protein YckC